MFTSYVSIPLTEEEVCKILSTLKKTNNFRTLIFQMRRLEEHDWKMFEVLITPQDEEGEKFVKLSFEKLTLKEQGWNKKFSIFKKPLRYKACILSHVDVIELIRGLYKIESARGAKIEITPGIHNNCVVFKVTITPLNDIWLDTLQASLKDGLLHHWGWDKRFELIT